MERSTSRCTYAEKRFAVDARLSICAIYQDEAPYLREWVAFHRLIGVEHFFLYDHESTDTHRSELAPFVDDGIVLIHDWPVNPGQRRPMTIASRSTGTSPAGSRSSTWTSSCSRRATRASWGS